MNPTPPTPQERKNKRREHSAHILEIVAFLLCAAGCACRYYNLWPWYIISCAKGIALYTFAAFILSTFSTTTDYARTAYTGNLYALIALSTISAIPGRLCTITSLVLLLMAGFITYRTIKHPHGQPRKGRWSLDSI